MSALHLATALVLAAGGDGPFSQTPFSQGPFSETPFSQTVVRLSQGREALALRDFTGDGAQDLLRIDGEGLALFPLGPDGTFASEPSAVLPWPEGRVGWDLSDLDGDGTVEILLLVEGRSVRLHRLDADGAFDAGREVLQAVSYLPAGVSRVRFTRDVDGDGRADLVLPGAGAQRIFLARPEGWAPPLEIAYEVEVHTMVGQPESLSSSFGQTVRVPWFRLEDVDGDGRRDLISETSERVAFHLADPELGSEPTWVLDLVALRAELPRRSGIDLDNLLSVVGERVTWRLADLDGRAPRDLIVALGAKFRVYMGGAREGPVGTPDQVLKSSGNVLQSFVRQVEGSPLPELQIVRGERIGIGRVLRTLILPGHLDFDIFTYRNERGVFSRKPTRRYTVTFEIPRLLAFIDEAEGLEDRISQQFEVPAQRLPRVPGAPAEGDDVVDVGGEELLVFAGRAPAPIFGETFREGERDVDFLVEGFFLEDLDARGDGAQRTLDLGDVRTYDFAPGAILRRACAGATAAARHPLAVEAGKVSELLTPDLDGDGRSDVIVVGEDEDEWVVQFLVRRGE